jgi:polar amino acid transport system substrate-binding protein
MKRLVLIFILLVGAANLSAQTVDDLIFVTENYAPLNYEEEGELRGIAVDALVAMLERAGAEKTIADIELWPWARGYQAVLNKKNAVLFSMARTEAREKLFKWVGPSAPSEVVLIAKKSRGIKIESLQELGQFKTGVVRDDIGEQLLLQLGVKKTALHQTNSGLSTAKMLAKDRIDMWAYEKDVAFWNLRAAGANLSAYEVVYSLKKSNYFYAFHRETDDRVIATLQKALDKLKADGSLEKIAAKYTHIPVPAEKGEAP